MLLFLLSITKQIHIFPNLRFRFFFCSKYFDEYYKISSSISRPYFEAKAEFNTHLEEQKRQVRGLESHVAGAKASYAHALRNLETISDEIHRVRLNKNLFFLYSKLL